MDYLQKSSYGNITKTLTVMLSDFIMKLKRYGCVFKRESTEHQEFLNPLGNKE